jgi:hypothetical protein
MTTDNFCFYLQNRLILTSRTEGQRYSDTFPFSIACLNVISIKNFPVLTNHRRRKSQQLVLRNRLCKRPLPRLTENSFWWMSWQRSMSFVIIFVPTFTVFILDFSGVVTSPKTLKKNPVACTINVLQL